MIFRYDTIKKKGGLLPKRKVFNMSNMFDISGKKAIVTGGTRGLGYSMAEALCEAGCDVVIIGSSARVHESAEKLGCKAVQADLASKVENYRAFNESLALLGGDLDILVNCAGVVRFFALRRIKPHTPLLVRAPVNSFEFQPCGRTPQVECLLR